MQTKENEQRLREMRMVELVDDVLAHKIQVSFHIGCERELFQENFAVQKLKILHSTVILQNLHDTSAVEEVLGEWDAVMADVQQQLGDDQLTTLNCAILLVHQSTAQID
jgi:hypothetical protein